MPPPFVNIPDLAAVVRPTVTDMVGVGDIENSEIRKIADDVLKAAQYSIAAVAANPNQEVRQGTLESAFKETLGTLPQPKREQYASKAQQLLQATPEVRRAMFGRFGELDPQSMLTVGFDRAHEGLPPLQLDRKLLGVREPRINVPLADVRRTTEGLLVPADRLPQVDDFLSAAESDIQAAAESGVMDDDRLSEIWGQSWTGDPFSESGFDDFEEQAVTNKLGFYVTRVKCVDETNPEWWGSDEIAIGGNSVDETGDTQLIAERGLGGGYDDGDQKAFSPHWQFHWFNMTEGTQWPKQYVTVMTLAEKDNGGFGSFLAKLWSYIRDAVKQAIEKAITGALSSYLGPLIASAIGKAVAWVVGKLVEWLISLFNDDIFPAYTASCRVPSYSARWYYPNGTWGSTTSGIRTAHFYGHGGHYAVDYYWRLYS